MSQVRIAYIGTHAKKGSSDETSYWKPGCPLDASKVPEIEVIGKAYLGRIDAAYCSQGFVRTIGTVRHMIAIQPIECAEIGPYGCKTDEEWRAIDPNADKTAEQLMIESPAFCLDVGMCGAGFIGNNMAATPRGTRRLFMTHRGVKEPIIAVLTNQKQLIVPVQNFEQGDLTRIEFNDDLKVVGMRYLPAAQAAAVLGSRSIPEFLDR